MEMPSTSQSERSQFRTAVEENLEDGVSGELMTRAVTLFPCGHVLNEDTVIQCIARGNLCPFDRQRIERHIPNYTIRHLAETAHTHPEEYHEEPPKDEAKKHFDKGKAHFESGEYEEGIAALLASLQLSPTYAKAQGYLDACLNQLSHRNEASSPESSNNPREKSIEIALNILEHPEVKQDAFLYSILAKYVEGLISEESAELFSEEKKVDVWVQKLVGEDKKVRVFVASKLKKMHGEPSTSANIIPSSSTPSTSAASSSRSQIPSIAFGKAKWEKYFGDVGAEPPLPSNIDAILNSRCPFWPDQKVKDTHLLALIPSAVNGSPFTLNFLGDLIEEPKAGHATKYCCYYDSNVQQELGDKGATSSYWVLMTKDIVPNSRSKSYDKQKKLIAAKAKKSRIPYILPKTLEAATVILMHFVETGEALYKNNAWTYTRCEEKVLKNRWPASIGGFSSEGLAVCSRYFYSCGVAGLRKF